MVRPMGYIGGYDPDPLCGKCWLEAHQHDISQDQIDSQTLTVSTNGRTSILKASYKKKEIKTVLKGLN